MLTALPTAAMGMGFLPHNQAVLVGVPCVQPGASWQGLLHIFTSEKVWGDVMVVFSFVELIKTRSMLEGISRDLLDKNCCVHL